MESARRHSNAIGAIGTCPHHFRLSHEAAAEPEPDTAAGSAGASSDHAAAQAVGPEELMDLIAPKGLTPEAATALMGAAREAFVQAFRAVLLALSGFAYLSAIVAWFTLGPERKDG